MSDCFDHYMDAMGDNSPGGRTYEEGYDSYHIRSYPKDKRSKELANTLKGLLKKEGIKIYAINQAASGSCYIKFYEDELGQCRLGNHEERGRLGYRWQVRWDIKEKYVTKVKGHNQFIYPSNDLQGLVRHIKNYLNKILKVEDEFKCV